ncbi:30S ribosomal protein S5 [Vermiphilus pyriformis]|uniref:Small ribosomal subunit protein uS5 n=1 Tax=candidate division TM6 bacterium JCVI TM6SC1 TaxID=1306947 RepID=A0A0D2JE50_9BACT|nr:hypothetical protein J120_03280 [candidate division TM6 bacterium JCVI TM6SC1]UNE35380.1 MAG: 30S ribosomal protein S5 [Vermiphilus pyriformis]
MADLRKEEKNNTMVDYVVHVNRVTKVTKGGKRFSFSALVVSGDQQGNIGLGMGKSREVSLAIQKATNQARKNMIYVPRRGRTVPYRVEGRHCSSKVVICSASKGTGVIAGGAVRFVMEGVGIQDVLAKSFGSNNRLNVVKATFNALSKLRTVQTLARQRGKTINELVRGIDNGTAE